MVLVVPSIDYKDSYLEGLKEFHGEGRDLHIEHGQIANDFSSYIQRLGDNEKGINLPPGWVPATERWLIDNETYIGRLSIRHRLSEELQVIGGHIGYQIRPSMRNNGYGKKILALGLVEAEKIGLSKVLLTCDVNNIQSKKIIEQNGGILENIVDVPCVVGKRMRFWINIKG
jgi:predicted acetyltransferase